MARTKKKRNYKKAPKNTRVFRCVQKVKKKQEIGAAIAICQSSTKQSYRTGRSLKGGIGKKRRGKMLPGTEILIDTSQPQTIDEALDNPIAVKEVVVGGGKYTGRVILLDFNKNKMKDIIEGEYPKDLTIQKYFVEGDDGDYLYLQDWPLKKYKDLRLPKSKIEEGFVNIQIVPIKIGGRRRKYIGGMMRSPEGIIVPKPTFSNIEQLKNILAFYNPHNGNTIIVKSWNGDEDEIVIKPINEQNSQTHLLTVDSEFGIPFNLIQAGNFKIKPKGLNEYLQPVPPTTSSGGGRLKKKTRKKRGKGGVFSCPGCGDKKKKKQERDFYTVIDSNGNKKKVYFDDDDSYDSDEDLKPMSYYEKEAREIEPNKRPVSPLLTDEEQNETRLSPTFGQFAEIGTYKGGKRRKKKTRKKRGGEKSKRVKNLIKIFQQYPEIFPSGYFRFLGARLQNHIDKKTLWYKNGVILTWIKYQKTVKKKPKCIIKPGDVKLDQIVNKNQGNGAAKKIVLQFLKKFEKNRIWLEVRANNKRAIKFYRDRGFKKVCNIKFGEIPGIMMVKN